MRRSAFEMNEDRKQECAKLIDSFLDGSCGDYDWDDFISIRSDDPEIQLIKDYCADSSFLYPSDKPGYWCNDRGTQKLARLSSLIKTGDEAEVRSFVEEERKTAEQPLSPTVDNTKTPL